MLFLILACTVLSTNFRVNSGTDGLDTEGISLGDGVGVGDAVGVGVGVGEGASIWFN